MFIFFFNDTATTEIYTLSLHDALPISRTPGSKPIRSTPACWRSCGRPTSCPRFGCPTPRPSVGGRSEEHTSELQSRQYLVCRLLLEKKNKQTNTPVILSVLPSNTHVLM